MNSILITIDKSEKKVKELLDKYLKKDGNIWYETTKRNTKDMYIMIRDIAPKKFFEVKTTLEFVHAPKYFFGDKKPNKMNYDTLDNLLYNLREFKAKSKLSQEQSDSP